jgi:hypothetical protein
MATKHFASGLAMLLAAAGLAACTTIRNLSPQYSEGDVADKGLVVFSTSADTLSTAEAASLVLLREQEGGPPVALEGFFIDSPFQASQSPTEHRAVSWRALEPGRYILSIGISNPYRCYVRAPEYHFAVGPGERLYLGEFHRAAPGIRVLDGSARDMQYFSEHSGIRNIDGFRNAKLEVVQFKQDSC